MSPKARKREERQDELEAIAKHLLVSGGLPSLTIDGVAKNSPYSRPTVHKHFGGKDGLLDTVAAGMLRRTKELADAAAAVVDVSARERALTCILAYEILARFHPDDFHIFEYLGYPWVLKQLPPDLRENYRDAVTGFSRQLSSHIRAATEDGSLELRPPATAESITFHSISFAYGSYSSIIKNRVIFQLVEPLDAWRSVREALDAYWDGCRWAPRSTEIDYRQRAEEILKEVFPTYWVREKTEELERQIEGNGAG